MPSYHCCFCGQFFIGYGNNPRPVVTYEGARYCDGCNASKVIPARLKRLMEKHDGTEQS